jgi:hypothetical protein
MDGSPLLATMADRHRCAARHFFVADTIARSRGPTAETPATRFHCYGKWNFGALLALLLILVFVPNGVREPLMLIVAMVSYFFTPQRVFEANEFSWRPLIEVAWIFLGIFGTMIPVLRLRGIPRERFPPRESCAFLLEHRSALRCAR